MNNYFSLRKRGLALFVALMMCLSMLPGTALAADDKCPDSYDGTHSFVDGICKACGQLEDAGLEETQEPEEMPTPEETKDPEDSKECEHKNIDPDSGACKDCGASKADMTNPKPVEPEQPTEPEEKPEEKPEEHEHSWTYQQNFFVSFEHTKTCSTCGDTVTEKCNTVTVYDYAKGQHVAKCTNCTWADVTSGAHKADTARELAGFPAHVWYCAICGEQVGDPEPHNFVNGKCVCGAEDKTSTEPELPEVPEPPVTINPDENDSYGTCVYCGHELVLKENGYIACSNCNDWEPQPSYKPDEGEIWCSACSDYADHVACGGWVCYTGNTETIKHVLVKGTNCVDVNIHDHECDECHAPMVERDWVTVKEPTCVAEGLKEYKCTYEYCKLDTNPKTESIPALNLEDLWGEWKDNGDGTSTRVCTFCKGEVEGHKETTTPESKYTLTICYEFPGGKQVFDPYTKQLEAGTSYEVVSPQKAGYKCEQDVVTGTMPAADEKVTVKYELITYTWTINYVDEAGNPVDTPFTKDFTVEDINSLTAVTSPTIEGCTADTASVAAPTELGNVTVNVVYRAEPAPVPTYTVTIRYEYADGTQAAPTRVLTVEDGGDYNVTSPEINGYTTNQLTVSGTINGEDVEVTVIYTAVEEPEEPEEPEVPENPSLPTPPTPTTPSLPAPDTTPAAPADPGMSILDEETPLGGTIGLDTANHFAYIIGYEDGTVRPLDNISRAEAVTIFFRLMTDEYRTANWSTANSFSDVNAGDWYNNAISTCLKAGALGHFAQDGSFLPNQDITRAEFASIAAGFIDDTYTGETVGDFSDTAGHWAAEDIRKAVEAGWITGDGNQFRPDDPITRADVMTMVNRMLDRVPDAEHMLPDMITWIDNPEGTWYYEAVQEATNEHSYERDEMGIVEHWTALLEARDWKALEEEWAENGGSSLPEAEKTEGE